MELKRIKRLEYLKLNYGNIFSPNPSKTICLLNMGATGNWAINCADLDFVHGQVRIDHDCSYITMATEQESETFMNSYQFKRLNANNKRMLLAYCEIIPGPPNFATKISRQTHLSFAEIPGLHLITDFISEEFEQDLLNQLKSQPLHKVKNRFVQHFGFKYTYENFDIKTPANLIPIYIQAVFDLIDLPWVTDKPNQATVSKYPINSGISPHTDIVTGIGSYILGLTLNDGVIMDFGLDGHSFCVELPPRSLCCLTGDSRYKFTHGIKERRSDILEDGHIKQRGIRWSITMRYVS
eukprot:NODE_223_length_12360_cov_0.266862.p3 type:complete len:295 gc:universal NODE_223_length_12360_cov_0.266862:6851-5967(-)